MLEEVVVWGVALDVLVLLEVLEDVVVVSVELEVVVELVDCPCGG